MPKAKKEKPFGCAGCPLGSLKSENFVEPFIPMYAPEVKIVPEIIILGNGPLREGGESEKLLKRLIQDSGVEDFIFLNAANCNGTVDTNVIKSCREAYVKPILDQHPGVPVLVMGSYAASSILGGRRSDEKLAGHVKFLDGREVYFTYSPSEYFTEGKNPRILKNIEVMFNSCLASVRDRQKVEFKIGAPLASFYDCKTIYIDLETTNENGPWYGSEIAVVGMANEKSDLVYIVPFKHKDAESEAKLLKPLKHFKGKIKNHNLNFDLAQLAFNDLYPEKATFGDTQIYERCRPVVKMYREVALKWLAKTIFGLHGYEAKVHTKWDEGRTNHEIPIQEVGEYCAWDVLVTKSLDELQEKEGNENQHIYDLTMDYFVYLLKMEMNGLYVDEASHIELDKKTKKEVITAFLNLSKIINRKLLVDERYVPWLTPKAKKVLTADKKEAKEKGYFNPRSPEQIKAHLKKLKINIPDTQEETLEEFKSKHPFIAALVDLRHAEKLDGTYTDRNPEKPKAYYRWIDKDGLIHSSFGAQGTESGRCNSSDPNVQNTPKKARVIFRSRWKNGKLVTPDLSALEYRIIAHVTQDSKLLETFKNNRDIHKFAAFMCLGNAKAIEAVSKEDRREGKTINYAGVYGCGPEKFFTLIGREDMKLYRKVQNLYPGVERWKRKLISRLHETGRVVTIFGRVREFEGRIRGNEEREAINWAIQSTGHDILKIFLMAVYDRLEEEGLTKYCLLANEIHDAFIFDCQPKCVKRCEKIILEYGKSLNSLIEKTFGVTMSVPILSDTKILDSWGDD